MCRGQFVPNQQPMQPATPTNQTDAATQPTSQQLPVTRPFAGRQSLRDVALAPPVAYGQPASAPTFRGPAADEFATHDSAAHANDDPGAYPRNSVMPSSQVPIGQQQAQQAIEQATLQQQLLQQQAMQQQLVQQRMLQQQDRYSNRVNNCPCRTRRAATVNYPAAGQSFPLGPPATVISLRTDRTPASSATSWPMTCRSLSLAATPLSTAVSPCIVSTGCDI